MKIYKDVTNDFILSVTDEGYGFPVSTALAAMGMSISPLIHKLTVEQSVRSWQEEGKHLHILSNEQPLVDVEDADEPHPYAGMTLDEVIAKFCPEAPEEI